MAYFGEIVGFKARCNNNAQLAQNAVLAIIYTEYASTVYDRSHKVPAFFTAFVY